MNHRNCFGALSLAATLLAGPALAQNTNNAEISCRNAAASLAQTNNINVGTNVRSNRGNITEVDWQVRDGRTTYRGYCDVDRNARVQQIQQTEGPRLQSQNQPAPNSQNGGVFNGVFNPQTPSNVNLPRLSLDTGGKGTFNARGYNNTNVSRAWVNTENGTTIAIETNGRRITFNGNVTNQVSDREFQMNITGSSEGVANGAARFRLNGDRNEVEMVNIDGFLQGNRMQANFNRN